MNSAETFNIKINEFEGPINLLHNLIESKKMQINTVSLANVTDSYISFIKNYENLPIDSVSRFVHIASILILIKSKSLLPIIQYTEEEAGDIALLENRLKIYDFVCKKVVKNFDRFEKRSFFVFSKFKKDVEVKFFADDLDLSTIQENALTVCGELAYFKKEKKLPKDTIRIEDVIENVIQKIKERVEISFKELKTENKRETIVNFLAVLELVRKDILSAFQEKNFDNIVIKKNS